MLCCCFPARFMGWINCAIGVAICLEVVVSYRLACMLLGSTRRTLGLVAGIAEYHVGFRVPRVWTDERPPITMCFPFKFLYKCIQEVKRYLTSHEEVSLLVGQCISTSLLAKVVHFPESVDSYPCRKRRILNAQRWLFPCENS